MDSLSFRHRLQIVFGVLSAGITLLALIAAGRAAEDATKKRLLDNFDRSLKLVQSSIRNRMQRLEDIVALSVADPIFRSQVGLTRSDDSDFGLGEANTDVLKKVNAVFRSASLPLKKKYPVLCILNSDGILLFSNKSQKTFGTKLNHIPLIERALDKGRAVDLWSGEESFLTELGILNEKDPNLYLVMARAISTAGEILGVALAGERVSNKLLPEFEQISQAKVALFTKNNKIASSYQVPRSLGSLLSQQTTDPNHSKIIIAGEENYHLSSPIYAFDQKQKIGSITLLRSISKEMRPFKKRFFYSLIVVLFIAIMASTIIASYLAKRLTTPLLELEAGVSRIGQGDLSHKINVRARDEVGRLSLAFNKMVDGLRDAVIDPLTQTYNRRYLIETLESRFFNQKQLERRRLVMIFADIDHFKKVNDTHGHDAGDFILKAFANLIQEKVLREGDLFCRYGGEEFIVLLPSTDLETASNIAERIRAATQAHQFIYQNTSIPITVSLGVAARDPQMAAYSDLLKAADEALYQSKSGGRNRVTVQEQESGMQSA